MQDPALKQLRTIPSRPQLALFAGRLLDWLSADLNPGGETFTESRARALLSGANVLDEPTRTAFYQLVETEPLARLALYDLLRESGLAENGDVNGLAIAAAQSAADKPATTAWLALAVAAHAWRSDFRLAQLDPAATPDPYSPAGQVLKRAGYFIRQQVQRSATERDKLSRKLAYQPAAGAVADLDSLQPGGAIAPVPPYYRTPVPVRYPEFGPKVTVDPTEVERTPPTPERTEPVSVSSTEVQPPAPAPARQPAIRIDKAELEQPRPATPAARPPANVVMPPATATTGTTAARGRAKPSASARTTKLRVIVQEKPDGPGLYGLQVRVSAASEKRFVAGTTNREGHFLCELPVRLDSGLTYDVDVTWPRDYGGEIERKSITLSADRTQFVLPFYRSLKA